MVGLVSPEVNDDLLSLAGVKCKAVILAPTCQLDYLIPVLHLVVTVYQSDNCGVVGELNNPVVVVDGCTIMSEQRVQPRAETAALGCAGVEDQGG